MGFAQLIMLLVALIAGATVVAVMYFGVREDEEGRPHDAESSGAANTWDERARKRETAHQERVAAQQAQRESVAMAAKTTEPEEAATPVQATASGASTGQSISDLSDEEKEAKRKAAMERRKKRAAQEANG